MKKMKAIMNEKFGRFSRLILKITVPMVLVQAAYLMYYIFSHDTFSLFSAFEIVTSIAESVIMSLLLSVGGCLLMDGMEKRERK